MRGIGIDFGAANSLLATFDGKTMNVRLAHEQAHSSIVWYKKRRQPRVGAEAKDAYMTIPEDPDSVFIKSVKRRLASEDTVTLATRTISSEIATEIIFRFLLEDAKISPQPDDRFVIAIPKSLTADQREEIRRAAQAAGFNAQFMVPEALAAIAGYLERESANDADIRLASVLDWGAGFVEMTLIVVEDDWIAEIASFALDEIAGDDIDMLLAREALRRFMEHNSLELERIEESMPGLNPVEALLGMAEEAKIALSSEERAEIKKPGFCTIGKKSYDLDESFTRAELEKLIKPLVDRALRETGGLLSRAGLTPSDIDLCLILGESTDIPLVKQEFESLFGEECMVVPGSSSTLVAEGAAVIACRNWLPRLAADLSVLQADESEHPLVRAGTAMLPEDEPKGPEEFVCIDPREGVAQTVVRALHQPIEMEVEYVKTCRVYNLPRLFIEAGFDENQVFYLRVSSGKSDSKDRFELEYTFLPIALLTRESADDERLVLMDDIAQPTAQASSSAGEGAHAANIMPAKAGRKQIWANVPVDLLVQLEPQIRDVRLMEKYLTNEQVEEYVRMLQPTEIDDSTNDTAIG
ncbi:MAG: Hsp70 family protein [Firmicutes bacterium]|nr:Hsp70 family protein [Bacillota bacterium]